MPQKRGRRGYGRRHHELRLRMLPLAIGRPCSRCGEPMLEGQPLDLDHTDDREGYRGFSHASCNRRAPSLKRALAPPSPTPVAATRWGSRMNKAVG